MGALTFISAAPFTQTRTHLKTSHFCFKQRTRRRPRPPTPSAHLFQNDEDIPEPIKDLNRLYKELSDSEKTIPDLAPDVEENFLNQFPQLRRLHEQKEVRLHNGRVFHCDDDAPVFSKLYQLLRPRYPNPLLISVGAVSIYFATRAGIRLIRSKFSLQQIVTAIVSVETFLVPIFAVAIPVLFTLYMVTVERGNALVDCTTRMLVMYSLSVTVLAPIAGAAATGNMALALICGVIGRVGMLIPALWFWEDLCSEQMFGSTKTCVFFQWWRVLVTAIVLLPGIILRVLSLGDILPFGPAFQTNAEAIRRRIGSRFPIALSLFNDPRGLFFLSALMLIFVGAYLVYLVVFPLDLLQMREHRKSKTILSRLFVEKGVFQPDEHPEEIEGKLSLGDSSKTYMPSSAMFLKLTDQNLELDSRYLSSEVSLPIFALLDNEDDILRREGAAEWIKSREEQLSVTEDYSEEQRALDALDNWSRPLRDDESEQSFEEFFDTIDDSQYQYDSDAGEWVVKNSELFQQYRDQEDGSASSDDHGENEDEKNENIKKFAASVEMEPFLKRYIEDYDNSLHDDDSDDGSQIYV